MTQRDKRSKEQIPQSAVSGALHVIGATIGLALLLFALSPTPAHAQSGPFTSIAIGEAHSCTITIAGGVKCWGDNNNGQLGDGTTDDQGAPVEVIGLESTIAAVAPGQSHTCALNTDGGVQCWGSNNYGQLGDGTTTDSLTPVDVIGLSSSVLGLVSGDDFSCALTESSGVQCWGDNADGQLGDGTGTTSATPMDVTGLSGSVDAITAGVDHACALIGDGLQCWGDNDNGQLGDGTTTDSLSPVTVAGLSSGVTAIGVRQGADHTCVLTSAGGVQCWGDNSDGQLGNGTTTDSLTPVDVSGLSSGVAQIAIGEDTSCVITDSDGIKCWGDNINGQVGDGTLIDRSTPVDVVGLTSGVAAASVGDDHGCVLTNDGTIQCWGDNGNGELGDGAVFDSLTPVDVVGLTSGVTTVDVGYSHACALVSGGVKCWGDNRYGQLGDGTESDSSTPLDISGLTSGVDAIALGNYYTCALTAAGGIQCWGRNNQGQLGDGTTTDSTAPVDVSGLTSGVAAVGGGDSFSCALTSSGGVKCWGDNQYGQLGDGTTTDSLTPVDVDGLSSVTALMVSEFHACAIVSGGAKCWGANFRGQLGDGSSTQRTTPVDVVNLSDVTAIAGGGSHTCALENGGVNCWGANIFGQVGDGTTTFSYNTPQDVVGLTSGVSAIGVGVATSCAITDANEVMCWGRNGAGQIGDGTEEDSIVPVTMQGLTNGATVVGPGDDFLCLLTTEGGVQCLGTNSNGGLGDGSTLQSSVPVDVVVSNFPPTVTDDTYSTDEGVTLSVAEPGVLDNDADTDDDSLTAVLDSGPSNGTLTLNADGSFVYAPNAGYVGDDSFTYVANDGTEDSNIATVTIAVNAGAPPFASCGGYNVFEISPGVFDAPSFPGNLIMGTNGNDWLNGTNGNDLILGLAGADDIFARNGNDVICGGPGKDIIEGNRGNDIIYGESGADWLIGNRGNDILYGGDGRDDLVGNNGQDRLYGEKGYDILLGGRDNDLLFGGENRDDLYGNQGDDGLNGGPGNDFCLGNGGSDTIDECEGASAANVSLPEVESVDEETVRRNNDGENGEDAIEQRIHDLYLPVIANRGQ